MVAGKEGRGGNEGGDGMEAVTVASLQRQEHGQAMGRAVASTLAGSDYSGRSDRSVFS